jgi:hypothetical protein
MQAIVLISGVFTPAEAIGQRLAERTGYPLVLDQELVTRAAEKESLSPERFEKTLFGQPIRWGLPTRSRYRAAAVAAVRETMAAMLVERPAIFCGHLGLLLPQRLAMRTMVHADTGTRLAIALKKTGDSESVARSKIQASDERLYALTHYLRQRDMVGDYGQDLILQTDRMDADAAVDRIVSNMAQQVKEAPAHLDVMRRDFVLAASVERHLAGKGYAVQADVQGRDLLVTLDQPALFVSRALDRVKRLCAPSAQGRAVRTRIGSGYYRADICHRFDFRTPRRVILKKEARWYAHQCAGGQVASQVSPEQRPELPPDAWA